MKKMNPYLGRQLPEMAIFRNHAVGKRGAVSSNSTYATKAGLEMLKQGGNAIDAAVAISLVLGAVEPYHSGIGGGCFHVVYHKETDQFYAVDARGVAPIHATQDMFLDQDGNVDLSLTEFSGRSTVVPALYRAMDQLLKKFGTMTWEQVSAPAVRLCREGFHCGFYYSRTTNSPSAEHNRDSYEGLRELYLNHGRPREVGELIQNPDLADTMETVAKNGVDWFYNGPIADEIVAVIQKNKGVMVKEDLAGCKVKERTPVRGNYRGYVIVSMPPPSSGGTHMIQMLNILEQFNLKKMGFHSADSTHALAETMKLMFADRSVAMGDPDFVHLQTDKIISKQYAKELAAKIDMGRAQEFAPTEGIEAKSYPGCTSHFSVMDGAGNVVVQTQTIRNWWGCGIVVPGRGFILNNTMADFSPKAGARTTQGLAYGMANAVCPGKAPLSSMSPTIILKDGVPILAVGAAGGPRIITSTLQLIVNVLDYGMPIEPATRAAHICCLTQAQGLELEYEFSPDTIALLRKKGHKITQILPFGCLKVLPNGVQREHGYFLAAGTNRCDGGGGVLTESGAITMDGLSFV